MIAFDYWGVEKSYPLVTNKGSNSETITIKDCIDVIGSKKGTIYLKHDSDADTTIYTVSTDLTIPENICFMIENGAVVSVDNGNTLTINGAFEAGLYQVFNGEGRVYFGDNSVDDVYPEWWGAKRDGITNDYASIYAAVNSGANFVIFSEGEYLSNTEIMNTTGNIKIIGNNSKLIFSGIYNKCFFNTTRGIKTETSNCFFEYRKNCC